MVSVQHLSKTAQTQGTNTAHFFASPTTLLLQWACSFNSNVSAKTAPKTGALHGVLKNKTETKNCSLVARYRRKPEQFFESGNRHGTNLCRTVYSRFPDGYFPGWFFSRKDVSRKMVSRIVIFPDRTFPGKMIPGWSLSRKDVSRVVIFPDETISNDYSTGAHLTWLTRYINLYQDGRRI